MAIKTTNIKLNIIEDSDAVNQDLTNANTTILETELSAIKTKTAKIDAIESEMTIVDTHLIDLDDQVGNVGSKRVDETSRMDGASLVWDAALDKYKHVVITGGGGGTSSAEDISNNPAGNISSENVQDAINELDTKKANLDDLAALEIAVSDKADKTYVNENFYAKSDADAKFLELAKYDRTRAMIFSADGQILRYPWAGTVKQVQANCSTVKTADIPFYLEKMSKADYDAGVTTWTRIGGTGYTMYLLASDIYIEYFPTSSIAITVNDLIRITVAGTAVDNFTAQVLIENTLPG